MTLFCAARFPVSIHALVRVRLARPATFLVSSSFNPRTRESATSATGYLQ